MPRGGKRAKVGGGRPRVPDELRKKTRSVQLHDLNWGHLLELSETWGHESISATVDRLIEEAYERHRAAPAE